MKFHPHGIGRDRQTVTFNKVKERIEMKIQKEYEYGRDIAESIRDMKLIDLSVLAPELGTSKEIDPVKRVREEKAMDIIFQQKTSRYLKRIEKLEENMGKAYSLIYENYCDSTMQTRIKEHPKYYSEILDNPIKLLEAIGILMHEPVRAQFSYVSMMDAHRRLLNVRQREREGLVEYMERFKQEKAIVKSHLGEDFLNEFVEHTEEYKEKMLAGDTTGAATLKTKAFETYTTGIFMHGGDRARYGGLLDGLSDQYALGNDQYPRTLQGAIDVMRRQKKVKDDRSSGNKNEEVKVKEENRESSFAQSVKRCYCCGSTDHLANKCPVRSGKPRNEWYDRIQGTQHHQQSEEAERKDSTNEKVSSKGWSGFQQATVHTQRISEEEKMRKVIMLDSGTTVSLFCNEDLVNDIRGSKDILNLTTNAGSKLIRKEATVQGFGTVKFDEDSIANIFGLHDLTSRYRVTFDSAKENAFLVETEDGVVKFEANGRGLYLYQPSNMYLDSVRKDKEEETGESHLQTIRENRKGFNQREYDRALQARRLMHIVGAPTTDNLKSMLRQNVINNCPITTRDVDNAEKIFGKDISTLKGKSTRPKPTTVIDDYVDIPTEIMENNREVELCMDIMYINDLPFLTTIDRQIKFRSLVPMDSRTSVESFKRIDMVLRHYNQGGFTIRKIYCDGEFRSMMDKVTDEMGIEMNYANPDEHVPEIERSIRTIKERFRTAYYRLPYKNIPKTMIKHLAMKVTSDLNLFPVKGGVSEFYSPNVILSKRNLDYKKHCMFEFGSYVQASQVNYPSNTNKPRTIDAIYLRPTKTIQGGHEVLDLRSNRVITRPKVTAIPVTDLIIEKVEAMATEQGIKSLKFFDRKKKQLYNDTDLSAGVNHNNNNNDNDSNNDNDNDSNVDDEYDDTNIDELIDDEERPSTTQYKPNNNDDINEEERGNNNVASEHIDEEPEQTDVISEKDGDDVDDNESEDNNDEVMDLRRSKRARTEPNNLSPTWKGKSYLQAVTGNMSTDPRKVEMCHNLVTQVVKDENRNEYTDRTVKVIARSMDEIRNNVLRDGSSFAQQYYLKKGLDKFGDAGRKAAMKELDQLY